MTDNAAQDGKAGMGETISIAQPLIVARQRTEIPVEDKWPRAWRMLFLAAAACALWAVMIVGVRWL